VPATVLPTTNTPTLVGLVFRALFYITQLDRSHDR